MFYNPDDTSNARLVTMSDLGSQCVLIDPCFRIESPAMSRVDSKAIHPSLGRRSIVVPRDVPPKNARKQ